MIFSKIRDYCKEYAAETCIFLLLIIIWLPCLKLGWIWDDSRFVTANPRLQFTLDNVIFYLKNIYCDLFTPFTFYSLMIDKSLFGNAAWGYHLHNILLFAASGALGVSMLRRLGITPLIAFSAVLLWGCSIQRVESVAWIAERKDVLCLFFMLLSAVLFMKEYGTKRYPFFPALFFLFSILAKPATPGGLLFFLIYAVWKEKSIRKVQWRLFIPIVFFLFLYGIWCWSVSVNAPNGMPHYVMNSIPRLFKVIFFNFIFYFSSGLCAFEANPHYPYIEWSVLPWKMFLFSVGILLFLCIFANRKRFSTILLSIAGWGLIWGGFFSMASGIYIFNSTDYADRYNLLPSLVLISMTAFFVHKCISNYHVPKSIPVLVFLLFSGFSVYFTWNYIPYWKNSGSLFRYSILSLPSGVFNQDRAYMVLGNTGVTLRDPELCQMASDHLMMKFQRIFRGPLDCERAREGRFIAACFFGQSAALLRKDILAQIKYYNLLRALPDSPWNGFNEKIERTDKYFLNFYFLLLSRKVPENVLREFLFWQDRKSSELGNKKDPYLTGLLLIENGKYAEALKTWQQGKKEYPPDFRMEEHISNLKNKYQLK